MNIIYFLIITVIHLLLYQAFSIFLYVKCFEFISKLCYINFELFIVPKNTIELDVLRMNPMGELT